MSETVTQEIARRIRVLLKRDGRVSGDPGVGFSIVANTIGNLWVTQTHKKLTVYMGGSASTRRTVRGTAPVS